MIKKIFRLTEQVITSLKLAAEKQDMSVSMLVRRYLVLGLIRDKFLSKKDYDKNVYRGM